MHLVAKENHSGICFLSVSCVNKMHVFHRHLFAMLLPEY